MTDEEARITAKWVANIQDSRLDDLKDKVQEAWNDDIIEIEDKIDLQQLITAEQQRRATRTEDVQRAIKRMTDKKLFTKIGQRNLETYGNKAHVEEDINECIKTIEDYNLAIQALEAYAPKEECEWCHPDNGKLIDIQARYKESEYSCNQAKFLYCPNCGRELKGEQNEQTHTQGTTENS